MVQCLFTKCSDAPDGGTAACQGMQDQSQKCQQCLVQELQSPTLCSSQVSTCMND